MAKKHEARKQKTTVAQLTRTPNQQELPKFYGRHACKSIWRHRRQDITRVFVIEEMIPHFRATLQWCAENKLAYHVVSKLEMEKITSSTHHEGIAFAAKARPNMDEAAWRAQLSSFSNRTQLLWIDGVSNPHNLGAIVRSSAHFGVPLILGQRGILPNMSPSACRIAEGGAEKVELGYVMQPDDSIEFFKKSGYRVVATSSHAAQSLYKYKFPKKSLIILGAETFGVSDKLESLADDRIVIPGTGLVESLNVSVAWGLIAGEYWRQHRSSK